MCSRQGSRNGKPRRHEITLRCGISRSLRKENRFTNDPQGPEERGKAFNRKGRKERPQRSPRTAFTATLTDAGNR
jgi:hypothetical protein